MSVVIRPARGRVEILDGPGAIAFAEDRGPVIAVFRRDGSRSCAIRLAETAVRSEIEACVRELVTGAGASGDLSARAVSSAGMGGAIVEALRSAGIPASGLGTSEGPFEAVFFAPSCRLRFAGAGPAPGQAARRLKVLVVDDSKTIRTLLGRIIGSDPGLDVVGSVGDPTEVERRVRELRPDVMTLDIHMPGMDGCSVLEKVLPNHPVPTVMISSISMEEGGQVLRALELGAVDYVQKPSGTDLNASSALILEKIRMAAGVKVRIARRVSAPRRNWSLGARQGKEMIVAIGSSTGGTEALREIFLQLPEEIPPILVVQHIPPVFSRALAGRLDALCPFEVREAEDGDVVRAGRVLIAPGGRHMRLERSRGETRVRVFDADPVNRHRPSVDVLFRSVAMEVGARSLGVILTGMGGDGAEGLLEMRRRGAWTIAQDEHSCVVFGMPREAIRLTAASEVAPLAEIPERIIRKIEEKIAA